MDVPLRKVTAKADLNPRNAFAPPQPRSRPGSPTKQSPASSLSPPSFRPRAKVNSSATVRKPSSSSSLATFQANDVSAPSRSRPGSPLRPSRISTNGSEPGSSPKARITARPTSRSGVVQTNSSSLESRQRALTSASAKLKPPHPEDRPRSESVIPLHHPLTVSALNTSSSPTLSQPLPSAEPSLIDSGSTNMPPVLAPVKVKSKVTGLVKSAPMNAGNLASRPLSPPYATTRPIHARSRTRSITSNYSPYDPPPFVFHPITTASPAANPHRYAPQRTRSPARTYPSPTPPSDFHSTKKLPLVSKVVDSVSAPLPPHSPPVSALSISSKSSVLKMSTPLNNDQLTDEQISGAASHFKRHSMEQIGQPTPLFQQVEAISQPIRDRSRSLERSPRELVHRGKSDAESEGPELSLRAEAKTNRKIADLEITNRSLLAINASLETMKNRQAKEIRDLRRKLRESRLILPPRTYKAVNSALDGHDRDDEDEDDDDDDDSDVEAGTDASFLRVRDLMDGLIESGRRALETRPEDFRTSLATKVLNADELRSWRDSGERTSVGNGHMDKQGAEDETIHSHLSPALVAVPDSGSTSSMGSGGELASDSRRPSELSAPPPITITHPL